MTTPLTYRQKINAENRAIEAGDHHGVDHQLNRSVLDKDSHVTGFGEHNRLVGPFGGCGEDAGIYTLREDRCAGLRDSNAEEREKVLYGPLALTKQKLIYVGSEEYVNPCRCGSGCYSTEHTYLTPARAARDAATATPAYPLAPIGA